jgi:membrane fusion protein (multidrug efflux system)
MLLAGCGKPDAQPAGGGMPPPAAVAVETVASQSVPVNFEYVGRLEASREVEIRPRVSAVIERRLFEEGAPVKVGALLYTLDGATFVAQVRAAEAELANRQATLAQARLDLDRNQKLAEQGFVSKSALDVSQTALAVAEAGVRAAEATLANARISLGYTSIRAPIAGVMGRAQLVEGALVGPSGEALTTLAQISPIYVRFSIGEDQQLAMEKQLADGELSLPGKQQNIALVLADGSRIPATGKLNFSDYKANPETGAFDMRATFANADGRLKPGQFARVVVEGGSLPDAITVPQAAVQDGPTGKFVYVVGEGPKKMKIAQPRPVDVGAWVGDGEAGQGAGRWVIKKGLAVGDKVIVEGTARIFFPGMPVAPSDSQPPAPPAAATPAAKPAAAPAKT